MTNEDAIRHIECVAKNAIEGGYDSAFCSAKALILVAEALKAEPCDTLKLDGMLEDAYEHGYQQARYDYEIQPCEDAVSRQAVFNQIFYSTDNSGDVELGSVLKRRIENLPPVTPKQRTGKWIHEEDALGLGGYYRCSCCGKSALYRRGVMKMLNEKTPFCPHCGAEMEGEGE